MNGATAYNSGNTDTHFVVKNYCVRSIVFAAAFGIATPAARRN